MTTTSITQGQAKQVKRFSEDAVDRAIAEGILDKDGLQRLIENGDEFQSYIIDGIRKLSLSNQYVDEEVESSYGYLSGYRVPKPIDEQVKLLNGFFPNLGNVNEKLTKLSVYAGSEGLLAIPRWQRVAQTYESALLKAFECLRETRHGKFTNYREGELGSDRLRLAAKTAKALEVLAQQQLGMEHHVMILPCQFGLKHRGRSVRRAREVMSVSEFGLDPFSVACMLLTHPERLQHYDDLWIDCAGADYAPVADGLFGCAPVFLFDDGEVGFGGVFVGLAHECYGAASGFVPQ